MECKPISSYKHNRWGKGRWKDPWRWRGSLPDKQRSFPLSMAHTDRTKRRRIQKHKKSSAFTPQKQQIFLKINTRLTLVVAPCSERRQCRAYFQRVRPAREQIQWWGSLRGTLMDSEISKAETWEMEKRKKLCTQIVLHSQRSWKMKIYTAHSAHVVYFS